jgi:hypothetical protein
MCVFLFRRLARCQQTGRSQAIWRKNLGTREQSESLQLLIRFHQWNDACASSSRKHRRNITEYDSSRELDTTNQNRNWSPRRALDSINRQSAQPHGAGDEDPLVSIQFSTSGNFRQCSRAVGAGQVEDWFPIVVATRNDGKSWEEREGSHINEWITRADSRMGRYPGWRRWNAAPRILGLAKTLTEFAELRSYLRLPTQPMRGRPVGRRHLETILAPRP